jgi:oligopeptidase A
MNPLLGLHDRPAYADIRPEHVTPAVDRLLVDADAALQRAVGPDVPVDYAAMSALLDVAVERLERAWGAVGHLQAVADTPALRDAHATNLPRVSEFFTRLGADDRLYDKYKAVAASPAATALSVEQHKALADALRDFVLGGAELQGAERERFAAIQDRLAELSQQFGNHVLDATDGFALYVGEDRLRGVPDDVRIATREAAAAAGRDGHKLTLHAPIYQPVLQYAADRGLRETLYRAHGTRASEFGPPTQDNTPLMREMLELRQEAARLLGHPSYAHLSLVPKMADSPEEVLAFVRNLAQRARPYGERDRDDLEAFAAHELGMADVQAWDRAFVGERLKQARFGFGSDEARQYFTEPRVLDGLFRLVERLFDISIRPGVASVWHDSVRYFDVERDGQPIAGFYVDLHARSGKSPGAWMDVVLQRWSRPDGRGLQLPVAHLVCNFAPPLGTQPALLNHDDVIALFHEFGHGLHHMLTRVDELAVSGIAGVEWDAAELPSQFMENFAWEWEVLSRLSSHVQTGAPLPRALFDKMVAARNFQSGLTMLRHCEHALFDMRIHLEPTATARVQQVADEVREQVAVLSMPPFHRYPNSFSHLFDGGYAAGYYGYAWAEVLSADAFSAFEEAGLFDAATGRRYREAILEVGGSRPALESFVAFRGREPSIDALLRHQGMT